MNSENDLATYTQILTHSTSPKSNALGWGMVLVFVVMNIFGALLLKTQIQKLGNCSFQSLRSASVFLINLFSSGLTFVAIGSLFCATIAWTIALANLELSKAYPVAIGLNFLIVMTSAIFFFNESIGFFKITGIVLIFFGIISLLK